MPLFIYPTAEGNLGVNTKNMYICRFSDVIANLNEQELLNAGVKIGDSLYVTDSDNITSLVKVDTGYNLLTYSTASGTFATEQYVNDFFGKAGEVKVNGANGIKPSIQWGGGGGNPSPGAEVQVIYGAGALDISGSEITKWPNNIATPQDSDFYGSTNGTFVENTIIGQRHEWRFDFSYSGKGSGAQTGVRVRFFNPNPVSTLNLRDERNIPNEETSGGFVIPFRTIADSVSLPAPIGSGEGYQLFLSADDPITVTLESVLRSSVVPNAPVS